MMNEGRKSKVAHKFEDNYGTKKNKTCPECGLPVAECICESIKKAKKEAMKGKVVEKKLKEAIRKLVWEVMAEASTSQIQGLIGKEAAIKYRKATGEVKTYFGRFTKMAGENVYMGVLGKGLRSFKVANILDVRPIASEMLSAKQKKSLDEMCKEAVQNPEALAAAIGRKKYGKEKFQKMATAGKKDEAKREDEKYIGFKKLVKQLKKK